MLNEHPIMQMQISVKNNGHSTPGLSAGTSDAAPIQKEITDSTPDVASKKYDAEALFGKFPK
jgi:hypothetical protein